MGQVSFTSVSIVGRRAMNLNEQKTQRDGAPRIAANGVRDPVQACTRPLFGGNVIGAREAPTASVASRRRS